MTTADYPFARTRVKESEIRDWLTKVLYPSEFKAGGARKSLAKKRIGARLHYARKKGYLAPSKDGLVDTPALFQWACDQRGWEVLLGIKGVPRHATVAIRPIKPLTSAVGSGHSLVVPNDVSSSQKALIAAHKENVRLKEANAQLKEETDSLRRNLAAKRSRAEGARIHGRKGRGIKKDR